MDLLDGIQTAATELNRLAVNMRDDQLGNPTPCADFTARDLINHVAAGAEMFALAFEQGSVPDSELGRLTSDDYLGDDFRATLAASIDHASAAFSEAGALEGDVVLPFGTMPREAALGLAVFDVVVHCSDLARATDQQLQLSDADAGLALELAREHIADFMRDGNTFAEVVVIEDDAGVWAELLAYTGRQP
jgi:uncharacterized protein (TIGR03086 family)